jgi:hypothetical protein
MTLTESEIESLVDYVAEKNAEIKRLKNLLTRAADALAYDGKYSWHHEYLIQGLRDAAK